MRDEQLHAAVALSTCPSQIVQSTSCLDHFWKLRCRTSASRYGAKHIWKEHMLKTDGLRAVWDVGVMDKCTAVVAGSICRSQNLQSTPNWEHCWKLRCAKSVRHCGSHVEVTCTKHHIFVPLFDFEALLIVAGFRGFCTMQRSQQSAKVLQQFPKL